jgi:hypothetical protein
MTKDERAQLLEDIKRTIKMREEIVERATADDKFDIAAAWETLDELEDSINVRVIESGLERQKPLT